MKWLILPLLLLSIGLVASAPAKAAGAPTQSADPHQQLDQILQDPMFQTWRQRQEGRLVDPDPDFSHRISEWFRAPLRRISDFIEWIFQSRGSSSSPFQFPGLGLPTFLKILAWIVLGLTLLFIVVLLLKMNKPPDVTTIANILSRQQVHEALEAGDALAMDSAQWMDEAKRLAAEQNFRAVYRALYLALLSGLHTAGKIEHNRNRTNWTYVQHYRGPADERVTFTELTQLFDRVWYGRRGVEGSNLEQLRGKVASLTGGVGG